MGTAIEWTDETWNPVTGCTKVSPGCKFCYAERVAKRYWGARKFTDVRVHADRLDQPLRWRRPRRIFVNSMSDLFHEAVPDDFIRRFWNVMIDCKGRHTFQILTKRPERMNNWIRIWGGMIEPWPHIWLGVSVEDQARADERIPLLLKTPAAVRFLSVEPLLGPVDIRKWSVIPKGLSGYLTVTEKPIKWVIVGGESGGPSERALVERCLECRRRLTHVLDACQGAGLVPKPEALAWVRSLRDQCVAAGVPWFFKQWGGASPKAGGRILDGRTWDQFPC